MNYKVDIERSAVKDLKPLEKPLRNLILQAFKNLGDQPFSGQKLSGALAQIRSLHRKYKGKDYRIAYTINKRESTVTVLFVGPRENLYQRLLRKLR